MKRLALAVALAGCGSAAKNANPEPAAPHARIALSCQFDVVDGGKTTTVARPKVTTLDGRAVKLSNEAGADPQHDRPATLLKIDLTPHKVGDGVRLEGALALSAGGEPKASQPIAGDRLDVTVPVDDTLSYHVTCDPTLEPTPASP